MLEIIILLLGIVGSAIIFIIFAIVNVAANCAANEKDSHWQAVRYRPVPPPRPMPKPAEPTPKPAPKAPEKKFLTVEEFVKKNLNLLDKLLLENKNFSLSEDILKDLDNNARNNLADWFMNMKNVDTVINNGTSFKVFMISP